MTPTMVVGLQAMPRAGSSFDGCAARFSRNEIAALIGYIDDHLLLRIRLDELSRIIAQSRGQLCRRFRVSFGISPHRFIVERRIRFAQSLMLNSALKLTDIAYECGFADQAHFSRVFLKYIGSPPGRWRHRMKQTQWSYTQHRMSVPLSLTELYKQESP
ncbi:MAG: AraC family transcriptional regulator [Steroidobacteraceae bacterium]